MNNAAPVADGDMKPTSIYTITEVEERFRVIAHLSQPIPQRFFNDDKSLEDFLASEMSYGLERALERQQLGRVNLRQHERNSHRNLVRL